MGGREIRLYFIRILLSAENSLCLLSTWIAKIKDALIFFLKKPPFNIQSHISNWAEWLEKNIRGLRTLWIMFATKAGLGILHYDPVQDSDLITGGTVLQNSKQDEVRCRDHCMQQKNKFISFYTDVVFFPLSIMQSKTYGNKIKWYSILLAFSVG